MVMVCTCSSDGEPPGRRRRWQVERVCGAEGWEETWPIHGHSCHHHRALSHLQRLREGTATPSLFVFCFDTFKVPGIPVVSYIFSAFPIFSKQILCFPNNCGHLEISSLQNYFCSRNLQVNDQCGRGFD